MASVTLFWAAAVVLAVFVLGIDCEDVQTPPTILTCNIRSAGYTGNMEDVVGVQSLVVSKKNPHGDYLDYENLVSYSPRIIGIREETLIVDTKALPNDSYVVEAVGLTSGGGFVGNQNTMKIEIRFLNPTCGDQGTFKCEALYFKRGSEVGTPIKKTQNLILKACLDVDTPAKIMTCDIRSAGYTGNMTDVVGVQALVVSKNTGPSDYENLVSYSPRISGIRDEVLAVDTKALPNDSYVVKAVGLTSGGDFVGNQNTMKIEIRFLNLTCGDRGYYKCEASYFETGAVVRTTIENTEFLGVDDLDC